MEDSSQGLPLVIDLTTETVRYGHQNVNVPARYLGFLTVLVERSQSPNRLEQRVHLSEVHQLKEFRHLSQNSVGQTIYRFLQGDARTPGFNARIREIRGEAVGQLVVSPDRKAKEVWSLHQPWISSATVTGGTSAPPVQPVLPDNPEYLLTLLQLRSSLELGHFQAVLETTGDHIVLPDKVAASQMALLRSEAFEGLGEWQNAWTELDRAQHLLEGEAAPLLRWELRLQHARLERLVGDLKEAGVKLRSLWADLPAGQPRLRGRLEVQEGLLLLDEQRQEPRTALAHFYRAAQCFLEAHWLWGVAQLEANIGLTYWRQAQHPLSQNGTLRSNALETSREHFLRSLDMVRQQNLPTPASMLVILGKVETELQLAAEAVAHLEAALQSARRSVRDEAEARLALAELHWQAQNHQAAQRQWQQALTLKLDEAQSRSVHLRIGNRWQPEQGTA